MQPIYDRSNFDGLVDEWCDCAFWDNTNSNTKTQLYEKTANAASTIESLLRDGNTKEAADFAKTILNTFTADQGFEYLSDWIAKNSMQSDSYTGGAFKSFHHLANALERAISPFQDQKAVNTIMKIDSKAAELLKDKSEKVFDLEALVKDWIKYAKQNETDTTAKMNLYKKTDDAAKLLEGSTKERAQFYAEIISNTFAANEGSSRYLTEWIAENTLKSGNYIEGAAKSFHLLAQAAQLPTIHQIDAMATNLLKGKDFSADEYKHGHEEQIVPKDVLNLILDTAVQNNSVNDSTELWSVAHKANYRGPLNSLGIETEKQAIAYAEKYGKELTFINIIGMKFTSRDKFKEFIDKLPNLETLHLDDFYPYGSALEVEDLKIIKNSCPQLVNLKLTYSYLIDEYAEFIAENFPKLQTLDLSLNKISDKGAKAITQHLKELVTLNLSQCWITDQGAFSIAENIQINLKKLKTLDLTENCLGVEGAKAIVESFKNHQIPVTIIFSYHNFRDDETQAIAESFKMYPNIGKIDLSGNHIANEGLKAIANNLRYLPNLKTLELSKNDFSDEGVEVLIENLEKHESIVRVNLKGCDISDEMKSRLKALKNIDFIF